MNKNRRLNVALFIVLPILSIIIGYFGMKIYLSVNDTPTQLIELSNSVDEIRHINDKEPNDEVKPADESLSTVNHGFKGISINCIQIASFEDLDKARKLAEELRQNGFGYYVYKGNKNRVLTEAYLSKEAATQRLSQIKQFFRDAYIVTFELDDINIDFKVTESQLNEINDFSSKMDKTLTSLNQMMIAIGLQESEESLKALAENELIAFKALGNLVDSPNIDEDSSYTYRTINDCAKRTVSTYSSLIEELENKGQSKAVYWEDVLKIYFQYIDFLEDL